MGGGGSKKFLHLLKGGSKVLVGYEGGSKSLTTKIFNCPVPHQSIYEHSLMVNFAHALNVNFMLPKRKERTMIGSLLVVASACGRSRRRGGRTPHPLCRNVFYNYWATGIGTLGLLIMSVRRETLLAARNGFYLPFSIIDCRRWFFCMHVQDFICKQSS